MPLLRYLMLLSLIVWLGGLIFFSFVVAPTVFSVLPTRHLAGSVVSRSLTALHWIGIVSGTVFLTTSMLYSRLHVGSEQPFASRHILLYIMLGLTLNFTICYLAKDVGSSGLIARNKFSGSHRSRPPAVQCVARVVNASGGRSLTLRSNGRVFDGTTTFRQLMTWCQQGVNDCPAII